MSDEQHDSDFERRTKRVFDDSVAALDARHALAAHSGALSSTRGAQDH